MRNQYQKFVKVSLSDLLGLQTQDHACLLPVSPSWSGYPRRQQTVREAILLGGGCATLRRIQVSITLTII